MFGLLNEFGLLNKVKLLSRTHQDALLIKVNKVHWQMF